MKKAVAIPVAGASPLSSPVAVDLPTPTNTSTNTGTDSSMNLMTSTIPGIETTDVKFHFLEPEEKVIISGMVYTLIIYCYI